MDGSLTGAYLFGALLVALIVYFQYKRHSVSTFKPNGAILEKDAVILDKKHTHKGMKTTTATIETDIIFSDGFVYTCHEYDMEKSGFSTTIGIKPETMKKILTNAMLAHQKAYEKQEKRANRKKR